MADGAVQSAAPHREVLAQVPHDQDRLLAAAAVARVDKRREAELRPGDAGDRGHAFTSIARRSPSLTRLNEIEVTKIAAPGSAHTQGWM